MAGAGYKLFNTGDVLLASEVNTYLMQQTVMVFASAAARTTALSGVVAEGMLSYLKDTDVVEVYNGSAWVASDDPNAIQNTIVDAKGDLITATAADTPARLAVGSNGDTLVADSAATTGLRWQGSYEAGKNKVINGDFGIWQRSTSATISADGTYYAPDRFRSYYAAGGSTQTWSRETFTPGTAPVAGYEGTYFSRQSATSGGASTEMGLSQLIEDVRTLAGQTVTISAWIKTDSARTVQLFVNQYFGSGGSATVTASSTTITSSTSWTRYSVTFSMPSVSGKTINAGSYLQFRIALTSGNASGSPQLDVWGVQLEAGSVATAFQTATGTLQGELAACQRYYYRSDASSGVSTAIGGGSTSLRGVCPLPVQMRIDPSSVDYSGIVANDTGAETSITAVTIWSNGATAPVVTFTSSSITQYRPYIIYGTYIAFNAEL